MIEQITDQIKKAKKVGIELSINDNPKILKYAPCLSFRACQEKIVELTDAIHINH